MTGFAVQMRSLGALLGVAVATVAGPAVVHAQQLPGGGASPLGGPVEEVDRAVRGPVKDATGLELPPTGAGAQPGGPGASPAQSPSSAPGGGGPAPAARTAGAPASGAPGAGTPGSGDRGGPAGRAGGGGDADSGSSDGSGEPRSRRASRRAAEPGSGDPDRGSGEGRGTLEKIVEVVPGPLKAALVALAALALLLGIGALMTAGRARRLRRQRESLREEIGVLQHALLPEVPDHIGSLAVSVGYRPAHGPGAGGDFYDVFEIDGDRVAIIVGDMSGHGRDALAPTTLIRHTLRAYLDAGLSPRRALALAGRVLGGDLEDGFATVVTAVYDPSAGTLGYACAGHPIPIVLGPAEHDPVTICSSPPLGIELPTGRRETTLPLPPGSSACFYTDGLIEARADGELIGRDRLAKMVSEAGRTATAGPLLDRLADEAERAPDDMAACIVRPVKGRARSSARVEELEADELDLRRGSAEAFLEACGARPEETAAALASAREIASDRGAAVLRARIEAGRVQLTIAPPGAPGLDTLAARAGSDGAMRPTPAAAPAATLARGPAA